MCNRLGTIPVCDGQTDGHTDILPRHSPRYAYASRGKNENCDRPGPSMCIRAFVFLCIKLTESCNPNIMHKCTKCKKSIYKMHDLTCKCPKFFRLILLTLNRPTPYSSTAVSNCPVPRHRATRLEICLRVTQIGAMHGCKLLTRINSRPSLHCRTARS